MHCTYFELFALFDALTLLAKERASSLLKIFAKLDWLNINRKSVSQYVEFFENIS